MTSSVRACLSAAAMGVLLLGVSAPALARSSRIAYTTDGATVRYDPKTDRYCISQQITGSLLPVTVCKSESEWAQDGLIIKRK